MQKATISELKNSLSAYLKKVRAGESVLILDRDQPVARIERIDAGTAADDPVARLERAGLVRRARASVPLKLLRQEPASARRSVVKALVEDRRAGR
jgi:antitoxin (DNA-binding transcriptional repressor) of toxin-antitoxin stability system